MKRVFLIVITVALLAAFVVGPAGAQTTTYTVQPGDTLFRIALRFGTTVSAIQAANGLTGTIIYIGQVLTIPVGMVPPPPSGTTTYTVQPGDNLFRIALRYGTTVAAIQQANNWYTTLIYVGQVLIIPTGSVPPPGPTATPPPPPTGTTTYVVQPGDTLYGIALRFGTTVSALKAANGLVGDLIYIGQVLTIPGSGPVPVPTPIPGPVPTPIPGTSGFQLGGQVVTFAYPDKMKSSGMTWVKRQINWNPGDSPNTYSGWISDAHANGLKILLSVTGGPANSTSDKYPSFASYVGALAGAGADGIEVWNEMNIDREWQAGQISPSAYVSMLSQAYNTIKSKNGNTLVVSGAPAPTGFFGGCSGAGCDDKPYLQGMVAAGALNYVDCIGIHYNEGVVPPTQTSGDPRGNPNYYTRYYQTMVDTYWNAAGGQKKLCFTELGYLSGEEWGTLPAGFLWNPPYNMTVAQQAQYLAGAVRLSRDQGKVRLLVIFNVDFTQFGADPQAGYAMVRPNGSCPACDTVRAVMIP